MKRWLGTALVMLVGFFATARGQQPPAQAAPEFVQGEVLVQYRAAVPAVRRDTMVATRRGRLLRRLAQLDIDHIALDPADNVTAAVAAFRAMPDVVAASPNYVRHAVQSQSPPPNDPRWLDGSLWGLIKIHAQSAWNSLNARGDGSVVIMDIDTGVNYNHQDLAANIWTNPGEVAGNGLDDDGDGYVDDVHGINTIFGAARPGDPLDDNGHGTHTAGTLAAVGNNGVGVVGVNWNAKILACKFLDASGSGTDSAAAACLNYAVLLKTQRNVNIRVTSNSWGGYRNGGNPSVLQNAFAAAGAAGIINFAAAGNGDQNGIGLNIDINGNQFDPASLSLAVPSIVAIAASDQNDNRASFSNYGPNTVSLAAPGVGILSTYYSSNTAYANFSGTSMATPHVAGTAALLSAMSPSLTVPQLKALITTSVDVLPQWGNVVGAGGRLNVFSAASSVGGGGGGGATATFVTTDAATQGNWIGAYGGDGYSLEGDATNLPAYATFAPLGATTFTWASSTSDARALLRAGGASGRLAATWYQNSSFDLDVNVTGGPHEVALYAVDWDSTARSERIDVLDAASSAQLDTKTLSGFHGGSYVAWNVSGHVRFHVTTLAGANAVVSGVFFGAAGSGGGGGASATFVANDTTTQGNWIGAHGADGYSLVDDATSLPGYATLNTSGINTWPWATSTSDARALLRAGGASGRLAATWYDSSAFSLDVNVGGSAHIVSLYCVDWDNTNRSERIDVLDAATMAVLDTRTVTGFHAGQYLVWSVTGHVVFRVTRLSGDNGVVSAIFFGS